MPEGIIARQTNEILRFQLNDVKDYLESINPDLSKNDVDTIYKLSDKGLARKLAILTEKLETEGIEIIRQYYSNLVEDFYEDDYEWIASLGDKNHVCPLKVVDDYYKV